MKIIIHLKEDNLSVTTTEPVTADTLINIFLSASLTTMKQVVQQAPLDLRLTLTNHLFDLFNQSASTLLAQFCPDKDLRPDITEEALLIAELQIQEKHNNKHKGGIKS